MGGIAEVTCNVLDRPLDGSLSRCLGSARLLARNAEAHRGEHGRVPGAEVLGAEISTRGFLQVLVYVGGLEVHPAGAGLVRQQLVAATATALERSDHVDHVRVRQAPPLLEPPLAS